LALRGAAFFLAVFFLAAIVVLYYTVC
jgi:hypothetical protein